MNEAKINQITGSFYVPASLYIIEAYILADTTTLIGWYVAQTLMLSGIGPRRELAKHKVCLQGKVEEPRVVMGGSEEKQLLFQI